MLGGFKKFLLRGNVVDLAVAVVIGAAFTAVVGAFTEAFLTPLIGLLIGAEGLFTDKFFAVGGTRFPWGQFVNAAFVFTLTAAVVYFFVVLPVNLVAGPFRDGGRRRDAYPGVPGVPVQHPGGGAALRLLHLGTSGRVRQRPMSRRVPGEAVSVCRGAEDALRRTTQRPGFLPPARRRDRPADRFHFRPDPGPPNRDLPHRRFAPAAAHSWPPRELDSGWVPA